MTRRHPWLPVLLLAALGSLGGAARGADLDEVDAVWDGTWQFSTVGTTAGMSQRPQDYTQVRLVHFANGAFTTNPLGFTSQGFRLLRCEAGGPVSFETPYGIGGGSFGMTFQGQGDDQLTHLAGSFTCCMASGTFSAIHLAAEPETGLVRVPIGSRAAVSVHLTLQPDTPITVHGVRVRGDAKLTLAPAALTFTPQTWQQAQDLIIDASAIGSTGSALIGITGPGLPETYLAVRLVRAPAVSR